MNIICESLFGKKEISGVKLISPFKKQRFLFCRIARKFLSIFGLETLLINKKEILNFQNGLIVFDGSITIPFLKWLSKNYHQRIILWLWNPVGSTIDISKAPKKIEIWSYSKRDCAKYGFKWNSTFMEWEVFNCIKTASTSFDLVYIGRNKKQKGILDYIKKICDKNSVKVFFYLTRRTPYDLVNLKLPKPVSYNEYLYIQSKANSILDIGQSKHAGLTLRGLEAMKLGKKIVCNYLEPLDSLIPKENVFYIDRDLDVDSLKSFLKKDFIKPSNDFFEYYSFSSWIARFD